MSGYSDSQFCQNCGTPGSMSIIGETRGYGYVSGECLECGFEFHVEEGQYNLAEVNETREYNGLKPLKKLKPAAEEKKL